MTQTKRRLNRGMDDFLPSAGELSDNMADRTKHAGGRPRRKDKFGPMQKATFRIPVRSVENLEKVWLKVRGEIGKKLTKSALIGLALDEIMPRVERGEFWDRLKEYLE